MIIPSRDNLINFASKEKAPQAGKTLSVSDRQWSFGGIRALRHGVCSTSAGELAHTRSFGSHERVPDEAVTT